MRGDAEDFASFEGMMSKWVDEAFERLRRFRKTEFSNRDEDQLKYFVTLHVAIVQICESLGMPPEMFNQFVTTTVAVWYASGKPEHFDFAVLKDLAKNTVH